MIKFKCPKCQAEYEEADGWIGAKVSCETCGARFYVPEEGHEAKLVQSVKTAQEVPQAPPLPQTGNNKFAKHCSKCGIINSAERFVCWQCNAKFASSEKITIKPRKAQTEPSTAEVYQEQTRSLYKRIPLKGKAKAIALGIIGVILISIVMVIVFVGRSEAHSLKTVTRLASKCINDSVGMRIDLVELNVHNKFSQQRNGETVYCYDFTYKLKQPNGNIVTMGFSTPFCYRIAIVNRGSSAEVLEFKYIGILK